MMPPHESDVNEFVYSFTGYCRAQNKRLTEGKWIFFRSVVYNFSKRFCVEIAGGRDEQPLDKPGTGLILVASVLYTDQ